jgi:hypothetical protein
MGVPVTQHLQALTEFLLCREQLMMRGIDLVRAAVPLLALAPLAQAQSTDELAKKL